MSTFAKIWSKVWYNLFSYELQPRWEITNKTMDNVHNVHGYHGYTHTASQDICDIKSVNLNLLTLFEIIKTKQKMK